MLTYSWQYSQLLNRPERLSWDEYREKHKEQLGDRLGAGVEREQQEYRKMLDAERSRKVGAGCACCSTCVHLSCLHLGFLKQGILEF